MSVSVIIPNYNNAPYLRQCIGSFAGDPAVSEIIVYDNASTDDSVEVIQSMEEPKVRLIQGSENLGATRARHEAIVLTRNEIVCFVDGDDFLSSDAVSQCAAALVEKQLDFALFRTLRVNAAGTETYPFIELPSEVMDGRTAFELTVGEWRIAAYGMMRRDLYLEVANDFTFHGFSDDELLLRYLFLRAKRVGGTSGTYFYRIMPKAYTFDKAMGGTRTALGVLQLAKREGISADQLQDYRNSIARGIFKLLREASSSNADRDELRRILADYTAIEVGWRAGDWREFAVSQFMKAAMATWPVAPKLLGMASRKRRRS